MAIETKIIIRDEASALEFMKSTGRDWVEARLSKCGKYVKEEKVCSRCGGTGIYSQYHGECWGCKVSTPMGGTANRPRWTEWKALVAYARSFKAADTRDRNAAKKAAEKQQKLLDGQRDWCEKNGLGRITFAERDDMQKAEKEAARDAKAAKTEWLGEEGDKVQATGTVVLVKAVENHFGTSLLVILETEDGNKVKCFTTARWADDVSKGDALAIKGTVKRCEVYQGEKSTLLKRPTLLK